MTKWNYKIEIFRVTALEKMDGWIIQMGQEGWELVQILPICADHNYKVYLKKPTENSSFTQDTLG